MSVSATHRPPYGPKCPSASGSFGAADEFLDLAMVFHSGSALDAGRDVDAVRAEASDDVPDGVGAEPARDEQTRRRDTGGERRVERDAGAAERAGDEGVE